MYKIGTKKFKHWMLEIQWMGKKIPHNVKQNKAMLIWYKTDFNTKSSYGIHYIMMKSAITQEAITILYLSACNKGALIYTN